MPGKAVQQLSGAAVAAPTRAIIAAMQAKFPPPPPQQSGSFRPAAPPAKELSCAEVLRAVRSFPRGAALGPTGMRPDTLKQIVDTVDEQYGAQALSDLVNLLRQDSCCITPLLRGVLAGPPWRKQEGWCS